MICMAFSWFQHKNRLVGNFHYYIRNRRLKIRIYGELDKNRRVHLFGTAPLIGFSSFVFWIPFFLKNNGFRKKMYRTLKIDLFIRYNFCWKYFFPRSIFIDIRWKNLLKTFFLVLTLKIKFASIIIAIFVISVSKYVGLVSFKLMEGKQKCR